MLPAIYLDLLRKAIGVQFAPSLVVEPCWTPPDLDIEVGRQMTVGNMTGLDHRVGIKIDRLLPYLRLFE